MRGKPRRVWVCGLFGKNFASGRLVYFGARYYDPRTSVWQSADPILGQYLDGKHSGGVYNSFNMHMYGYAAQNPLRYTDPDGQSLLEVAFLVSDFAELSTALGSGEGVFMAAANIAIDTVGVVSPIPGISEASHAIQGAAKVEKVAAEVYKGSKLARDMAKVDRGVVKGEQEAHHIVAQADKRAAGSRDILKRNKIDVHEADNGARMEKAEHRKVHTNDMYRNVEGRLEKAEAKGGSDPAARAASVRQELKDIGSGLEK